MKNISIDKKKTVATIMVAGFFIFFWVNGPLSNVIETILEKNENVSIVKPVLIEDQQESFSSYGTVEDIEIRGEGYSMILGESRDNMNSFGILSDENEIVKSTEYGDRLLSNAKHFFKEKAVFKLEQTENYYYAAVAAQKEHYFYFQSKGIADEIKGYSGPINVGVYIREDGYLHKMVHVNSIETKSYLDKISRTHYYDQYNYLPMNQVHELDGISGATISSNAMANTTTKLIDKLSPFPLTDLVYRSGLSDFETNANLNWTWILHIVLIFVLFGYALQKKWRKSKRYVLLTSIASLLFIGFYLNDSFTYITFMHPFIGTSLSSFMGIYALFVLLGAIWGKNTYCKYICPYGNIQRVQLKIWKGAKSKFPLPNKWIKRIRFAILIFLIAGILAGFRNLSHLEPYPYIFGFEIQSIWYFSFAVFALLLNWVYPMIWCRLHCPTGSVLDTLSLVVEKSKKRKK